MAPETRAMTGSLKRSQAGSPEPQSRSTSSGSSDADAVTRQDGNQEENQRNGSPQTPKPRKKRARFSDPGPNTTGLTPAMGRTGLGPRRGSGARTPSQSGRRSSAPIFLSDTLMDPVIARTEPIKVQFSPLKQVLDPRTRRRLVRSGLSEEMNRIGGEQKDLKKATAEIESLQKKLEIYESQQISGAHDNTIFGDNYETLPIGDDTMDGTMLISDSPTFHRYHDAHGSSSSNSTSPADTSPITPHTGFSQPVSIMNDQSSEELRAMAEDLAAIRKEKQDLFNEWRKLNAGPTAEPEAEATAPPADFMKQIVPRLEAALQTGTDLSLILDTTTEELLHLGFSGANLLAIIADLRESFQSAQNELDSHKSNGEPAPSQSDQSVGKATLQAFIQRHHQLSIAVMNERQKFTEISDAHDRLTKQFDDTLRVYSDALNKVKKLEKDQDVHLDDLIKTRMRVQALEQEIEEQVIAIERLHGNLKVVEAERDRFQALCEEVEEDQRDERRGSEQRITNLNNKISAMTRNADDQLKKSDELKDLLAKKQVDVSELSKHVDKLTEENKKLLRQMLDRDQEIGRLNTRYGEASTELQSAQADLAKAQELNRMLETHKQEQIAARNRIEDWFRTTVTQFSKVFDVEREHDRQNEVTKDIFTGNVTRHMELEPSLPSNSPVKKLFASALGNVRVGRGSDRSTLSSGGLGLDSGIGGSEAVQPQTDAPAGSDAFLEAIDEEGDENIE
ncbi:hypothetical protein DPV78_006306 [Talaromyces pinophilus]|nr:hypothetical protein DPV78_006306 [Talaromyces pinophilus]